MVLAVLASLFLIFKTFKMASIDTSVWWVYLKVCHSLTLFLIFEKVWSILINYACLSWENTFTTSHVRLHQQIRQEVGYFCDADKLYEHCVSDCNAAEIPQVSSVSFKQTVKLFNIKATETTINRSCIHVFKGLQYSESVPEPEGSTILLISTIRIQMTILTFQNIGLWCERRVGIYQSVLNVTSDLLEVYFNKGDTCKDRNVSHWVRQ